MAVRGDPVAERAARRIAPLGAVALLLVAGAVFVVSVPAPGQAAQFKRCSPVVGRAPGGGFDTADVLVVAGKQDCEKSRHAVWSALSAKPYKDRVIGGWTCSSTGRRGSGHLYGASCVREGEEREAVRSATPRPCHSCSPIRE
jgi:hypothetical protein